MNKKYLKSAIDKDINKNDNYLKITYKIDKKNNFKIYKYALITSIIVIFLSLFSLSSNNTTNNFNGNSFDKVITTSKDEIIVNDRLKFNNNLSYSDDIIDYSKIDGEVKKINKEIIIKEFKLQEIVIPNDLKNTSSYVIYTKNKVESKYNILHDYVLEYTSKNKIIKLSISKIEQPIKDYYFEEKEINYSTINGKQVIINYYDNNYNITFKLDNGYYDVEAENVSIDELIDTIKTIIK